MVRNGTLLLLSLILALCSTLAAAGCDTALLVIDVQDLFLSWHPWITADDEEIIDAVVEVLGLARAAGITVVYIQDFSTPNWERFYADRLGVAEEVAPLEGDPIFSKTDGNAFTNEELGEYLTAEGIGRLLVCGIASDGCVELTMFGAVTLGYDVTAVADAHASWKASASPSDLKNRYWESLGIPAIATEDIDWDVYACGGG